MLNAYGLARLGRDVELRYTSNGDAVANLSLAFSYGKKGNDGKRPTTWVDGTLWGKRAEAMAPYLLKGAALVVSMEELHLESFTSRDQSTLWKLVGRVVDVEFAGGSRQQDEDGGQDQRQAPQQPQAAPPMPPARQQAQRPAQRPPTGYSASGFDDMDSDIPF